MRWPPPPTSTVSSGPAGRYAFDPRPARFRALRSFAPVPSQPRVAQGDVAAGSYRVPRWAQTVWLLRGFGVPGDRFDVCQAGRSAGRPSLCCLQASRPPRPHLMWDVCRARTACVLCVKCHPDVGPSGWQVISRAVSVTAGSLLGGRESRREFEMGQVGHAPTKAGCIDSGSAQWPR